MFTEVTTKAPMDKGCYGPYPPATSGVTINIHLLQDFRRLEAHFLDTIFAAPRVFTLWSSVAWFHPFAIRLVAKVLFPGTGWVALFRFEDLIGLRDDFGGKRHLPRGFIDFFAFHTINTADEATISFRLRRPHFWRMVSELIMSLNPYPTGKSCVRAVEVVMWHIGKGKSTLAWLD